MDAPQQAPAGHGYEVHLEMFEGPLDLLLQLIKKNDLDIYDIPISAITQEYLSYIDLMKELNLETAGEFLIMAATLLQIKARALLPAPGEGAAEEGPDPRAELAARLLEYSKYKEAARFLEGRADEFRNVHFRGEPCFSDDEKTLSVGVFDLLAKLSEILESAEGRGVVVAGEEFPVEEKVQKILYLLELTPYISFKDIFKDETRRAAILSCFLALLELIKLQKVFARQEETFGEILIYKVRPRAEPIWPGEGGAETS